MNKDMVAFLEKNDFIMTEIRHKIEDYNDKLYEGKLHERI